MTRDVSRCPDNSGQRHVEPLVPHVGYCQIDDPVNMACYFVKMPRLDAGSAGGAGIAREQLLAKIAARGCQGVREGNQALRECLGANGANRFPRGGANGEPDGCQGNRD